jgi:putative sigma-54 modulation protein
MKITYTGKKEKFYPAQTEKLTAKLDKLAKLLDGRGERNAHVILASHRNMHRAEITVNYLEHTIIGEATNADQFLAINSAVEKLEKQVLKLRQKRWDPKKGTKKEVKQVARITGDEDTAPELGLSAKRAENSPKARVPNATSANGTAGRKPRVFRVDHTEDRKPMTLDEAMMECDNPGDYVVYRDANKDCLSVLLRRPDGNFDLIEG